MAPQTPPAGPAGPSTGDSPPAAPAAPGTPGTGRPLPVRSEPSGRQRPHPPLPQTPAGQPGPQAPAPTLSRRDQRWVLHRCSRKGHVLARVDDPVSARLQAQGPHGDLLCCLRCGTFVDPAADTATTQVIGTADRPAPLDDVPQVLRGTHGRKLALLRVLAVERGGRGLLLLAAAAGIARLASSHVAVADWLGQVAASAQPLGSQLGWDVLRSNLLAEAQSLLGHSGSTYTLVAWLLAGYGALQVVEGVGLWGGWLWAEYLAVVATSLFVPLEVYELVHKFTPLKAGALVVNLLAVAYLVYKGRLFGFRGGHPAYLAEVRDATLLADELRALGRSTVPLTGHHLV
ncbi:MAG TPA: DUF2127 domain-containing protein [Kineosporiaceae bacterium]|nr:DUF2127 domain-containing protein [Kineosporiaceae bacterium]